MFIVYNIFAYAQTLVCTCKVTESFSFYSRCVSIASTPVVIYTNFLFLLFVLQYIAE